MYSLGKNVGAELITRANLAAAAAEAEITGKAEDITALGARAQSVRAVLGVRYNADAADTLTVSGIKLQSSATSNFASATDQVAASNIVLLGATGDTNVDYFSEAALDLDLTKLPASHKYLRLVCTPTRSDTTNTSAVVTGTLVFGGVQEVPTA